MGTRRTLFTIATGVPFVDALAAGILERVGDAPDALAAVTVLLPTRRACRSLTEAFLRRRAGRALLLPRMLPLGDLDEDELALTLAEDAALNDAGAAEAPPAISGMRRQLLLARLVLGLDAKGTTPDQAARLAAELARLLDQVQTERLSFDGLKALVPADYAGHWQRTLEFLRIITEHWPAILAEEGCLDPAERRNRVLAAQAAAWRAHPPAHPVIAAGSTGSIPATADLLAVVACLPQGCVVLPGLDAEADAGTWAAIAAEPTHPQFGMAKLLERLGADPAQVQPWPAPGIAATRPQRARLLHEALRPAALTHAWSEGPALPDDACAGVVRIDCPGAREEAGAIALIMRETLETPGRTAALVTPDRGLARRVAAELRRWSIEVDDSAGLPLALTPPGAFLRLTARMVADDFAPVPLLAALKHPLAAGGMDRAAFRTAVRALEVAALRGPRPAAGLAGVRAAVVEEASARIAPLLHSLEAATGDLAARMGRHRAAFRDLITAHVALCEALAATDAEPGAERLWAGEAGAAAAAFVSELAETAAILDGLAAAEYVALLDVLMAGRVVRPRFGRHPRLHIWGLLEARLQHADVMILGGLNEGTWPPEAHANPWMSRPMLAAFGLPVPERRIGLTAHDFAQAWGAPQVVMTRAARLEGTPTVPSRWLLRLETLLAGRGLAGALAGERPWLDWVEALDAARDGDPGPCEAPAPRPPLASRPRRLSVTRIETWNRDPYAIYAEYVLGLKPLDPIDADPGAADRGIVVHEALETFLKAHSGALPADAYERMLAAGEAVFSRLLGWPGVRAFWWPRFERVAAWFVECERARRADGTLPLAIEAQGRLDIAAPGGPFTLTAKADRIDRDAAGGLVLIDYKTGQAPTWPQVTCGLVPQLTLEAAIAAAGGFAGVPTAPVTGLAYMSLTGGREAGRFISFKGDVAAEAGRAFDGLAKRIAAFDDPATPYVSRPRPMFESRGGPYDHLARVKEWLSLEGDGE